MKARVSMSREPLNRSRRRFLVGTGGVAVGLPWLEKLEGVSHAQGGPASKPKRMVVMTYPMGIPGGAWRPSATGSDFTLPMVTAPLTPFKDRCVFVSSIDHRMLFTSGKTFFFGHPVKTEAALTGTLNTGAFTTVNENRVSEIRPDATTDGGANAPSIEHFFALQFRNGRSFQSVDLGVDGDARLKEPPPRTNSRFFFEGRGVPVPLQLQPHEAFNGLFRLLPQGGPTVDLELMKLRRRNKSVLDAVRSSFVDLKQGLGVDDRRRLEEHAARIRSIELSPPVSVAQCTPPPQIPKAGPYRGMRMDQISPLQIAILAHAMACDLAPVGRLEYSNQQNPRFGISSLDSTLDSATNYDWHAIVHGDPIPGTMAFLRPGRGTEKQYDNRLLEGYRFFVAEFARLLSALDAIPEGPDTSVLDNTLVVLASDLGEGLGHGGNKMGYILAGNLGGAPTGRHFDAGPPNSAFDPGAGYFYTPSRFNVNQLLNSIADMAGLRSSTGGAMEVGLNGWISAQGIPRRIDGLFA